MSAVTLLGPVEARAAYLISAVYQVLLFACFALVYFLYHPRAYDLESFKSSIAAWDAHHYLYVANFGYQTSGEPTNYIAFLPLYPLLIRIGAYVVGLPHLSAFLVSNICSVAGHANFILLLRDLGISKPRIRRIFVLFMLTPTAVFFTLCYTEGLYFLLVVLFFRCLLRARFLAAGAMGMLASATKVFGVYLEIPYYFFIARRWRSHLQIKNLVFGLSILCGFLAYLWLNYLIFRDPLAFLQKQREHWFEEMRSPVAQYVSNLKEVLSFDTPTYWTIRYGQIATTLVLPLFFLYLWLARRVLPFEMLAWLGINWVMICTQSFWMSNLRYLSVLFPIYIMLEEVIRYRFLFYSVLVMFGFLNLGCMYRWVTGRWAY